MTAGAPAAGRGRRRLAALRREGAPLLLFVLLPLLLYWPTLWGQATLVPFDNLFQDLPWSTDAAALGVGGPHNALVSDLVLQNVQWKSFAVERFRAGELPLWQNLQLAGSPFLAAGQHSMLYPLSLLFLILPIPVAYGWFTLFSLVIAALNMYVLGRGLGLGRGGALIAGLTFQGSGFMWVSAVFPMILAAAAWLPLSLAAVHRLTELALAGEREPLPYLPWTGGGALALGLCALAGHVEILYYTLLIAGAYALWQGARLLRAARRAGTRPALLAGGAVAALFLTGLLIGAGQLIPMYELVSRNFRDGSASLQSVLSYAWPARQASTFLVPDLLGNPARHRHFNLTTRRWEPIVTAEPIDSVGGSAPLDHVAWFKGRADWKNYVEGTGYLGLLPLLLAALAVAALRSARAPPARPALLFFLALALVSLLFVFGSPLYALLFYVLPGFGQLHTPFRWLFPLTVAVAAMAGIGWEWSGRDAGLRWARRLALPVGLTGALGALLLGVLWLNPAPWVAQGARLLDRSALTQMAFGGSAELLVSYQWSNFLHLALALLGAGIVLRGRAHPRIVRVAALFLIVDLAAAGWGFMPTTPLPLADHTPQVVQWLADRHKAGEWRYDVVESRQKVLNANSTMRYGLEDVRGYDSIILKHYVEFMQAAYPQGQLDFNRIAPIWAPGDAPDQELLDLLNVRYLVSDGLLAWEGWQPVTSMEGLSLYENEDLLPRAFLLGRAEYLGPRETPIPLETLRALDPRERLFVQGPAADLPADGRVPESSLPLTAVEILRYEPDEIEIRASPGADGGWLFLGDVDFPGWRVFTRPAGSDVEEARPLLRANGAFRALWLEEGEQLVRFRYSPDSVKVGFFASFLGGALVLLLAAVWGWGRIYIRPVDEDTVQRVARNTFAPAGLQLFNKGIDTVFAAFMARFLGPGALGQYAFAVALIWYFIVFSNFGLGTLLTRDAARRPDEAALLLNRTLLLRFGLYLIAFPALLLLLYVYGRVAPLERETVLAILLLALGLIPSNISDALTAIFRAREIFEIPALVATVATFVKVVVGAGVLLAGYGIVGLAATSLLTNSVTLAILALLLFRRLLPPERRWSWAGGRSMLTDAVPLMINEFLAVAFFRIDQVMLKPLRGEGRGNVETGLYNVAFKFIDGLLILPSTLTLALFPVMSRYAQERPEALLESTRISLRWMVVLAVPIALLTTRYADGIILAFGGPAYLPDAARALQILIWFLPFSFVNSLLQYVLIAADRQHSLTRAYLWAVLFNIVANIVAIRLYGIYGAAAVTILSEIALLVPFDRLMRQSVGALAWQAIFLRPAVAGGAVALLLWRLPLPFWLLIPAALLLYPTLLLLLRTFDARDRALLARLRKRGAAGPEG